MHREYQASTMQFLSLDYRIMLLFSVPPVFGMLKHGTYIFVHHIISPYYINKISLSYLKKKKKEKKGPLCLALLAISFLNIKCIFFTKQIGGTYCGLCCLCMYVFWRYQLVALWHKALEENITVYLGSVVGRPTFTSWLSGCHLEKDVWGRRPPSPAEGNRVANGS